MLDVVHEVEGDPVKPGAKLLDFLDGVLRKKQPARTEVVVEVCECFAYQDLPRTENATLRAAVRDGYLQDDFSAAVQLAQ